MFSSLPYCPDFWDHYSWHKKLFQNLNPSNTMETKATMMPDSTTIARPRGNIGTEEYGPGYLLSTRELSGGKRLRDKQKKPGQPDMADGCLPAYLLWRKSPLRGQVTRLSSLVILSVLDVQFYAPSGSRTSRREQMPWLYLKYSIGS